MSSDGICSSLSSPLDPSNTDLIHSFLGHKGQIWLDDVKIRTQIKGNMFNVFVLNSLVVSHVFLSWYSPSIGHVRSSDSDVALLGHVYTPKEHRGKGYSKKLMTFTIQRWKEQNKGKFIILGVGNPVAVRLYSSLGFVLIAGSLSGGVRGYNEGEEGECIMVWSADHDRIHAAKTTLDNNSKSSSTESKSEADAVRARDAIAAAYFSEESSSSSSASLSRFIFFPLHRGHWAQLCMLFNLLPLINSNNNNNNGGENNNNHKFSLLGVSDGLNAEERMLHLFDLVESGSARAHVYVDRVSGRVYGLHVLMLKGELAGKSQEYTHKSCNTCSQQRGELAIATEEKKRSAKL